jgi:hypothetical protein
MAREAHTQAAILVAWGAHPRVRVWRQNTGVGWFANGEPARKDDPGAYPVKFGVPGCPDILGVIGPEGRFLGIEAKAPNGVQSDDQKRFQRVFTALGGVYILARSVADVDRALAEIGLTR